MQKADHGLADACAASQSPLARYGALDTCRGVMHAYRLYRYYLFKEKYENFESTFIA